MPGAAREPAHTHLYDEVILEVENQFTVVCCKVCGHYLIITRSKHRMASRVEEALIREILYGGGHCVSG